ncbi:MAG: hypothetical protein R2698_02925 [Microthrixaceae bacterium]
MTPEQAASALSGPIWSFGRRFMFDPATYELAAPYGFEGIDFYFLGRGGVLGDAPPEVVAAAFGFFEPARLSRRWTRGRSRLDPRSSAELFADACAAFGRTDLVEVDFDRLDHLLARVLEAADDAGLALFAGWRTMATADDVKGRVAQRMFALRELRGGLHLLSVRASGIAPRDAVLVDGGPPNAELLGYEAPFEDVSHLAGAMARAERLTNALAATPLEVLDDTQRLELVELATTAHPSPAGS